MFGGGLPSESHLRYVVLLGALQVFYIMLDQLKNHLIWLAHATSKDCPFKFQNWSGSGKTIRVKSEYSLMLIEKKKLVYSY